MDTRDVYVVQARRVPVYHESLFSGEAGPSLSTAAVLEDEMLFGESYSLIGFSARKKLGEDWVLIETALHGIRGWIQAHDHTHGQMSGYPVPTHRICVPYAFVRSSSSFKSDRTLLQHLFFNSRVTVTQEEETPEGSRSYIMGAGWVDSHRIARLDEPALDFVSEAQKLVGLPYLWGGRSLGFDCSRLVTAALVAAGIKSGGNVSDLREQVGEPLSNLENLIRGDFVFWKRHAVIMVDTHNAIHATTAEPYDCVVEQPLEHIVRDQMNAGGGEPMLARRIPGYYDT